MSLPSSSGDRRAATAAAPPPVEPPVVRCSSQGFREGPNNGLSVWKSAHSSGTLVLPRITAPAARNRTTALASAPAMLSLSGGWLEVVCSPATSKASLMVIGTPCSGPSFASFFAAARSAARAAFIAPSRSTATTALIGPFSRAIRSRCASVASRDVSFPFRMARASADAVSKHGFMHVSPAAPRG